MASGTRRVASLIRKHCIRLAAGSKNRLRAAPPVTVSFACASSRSVPTSENHMPLEDLPLDRPAPLPAPPGRRTPADPASPRRWVIVGALAVLVGGLLTLWWMSRAQPRTAIPAPTQATDVAVGSNRPKRQPMSLPKLDDSDTLLRELV